MEDLGGDTFTRTLTCAMLANARRAAEGVKTELYNLGASAYRDQLENLVFIVSKSIATTDKHYFQATGKCNLCINIPNGKTTSSILLMDILYYPKTSLTLVSIPKLVDFSFHSHFTSL